MPFVKGAVVELKIAQSFSSGLSPRTKSSPGGTKENLGRPAGTFSVAARLEPGLQGWAIFKNAVEAKMVGHNKGWTMICRPTTLATTKEIDRTNTAYSLLGQDHHATNKNDRT